MKHSLPESADDLLIKDGKLLIKALSVYEVLKRFSHIIRLTPFRFEDFCASLLTDDQSPLLSEIHIQLLRTLVREDRQQHTWLGPPDIKDAVNIYLHLADHITWPAALRIYLSADPYKYAVLLNQIKGSNSKPYPFNANLDVRLDVLERLCDEFLLSNLARDEIVGIAGSGSARKPETTCRTCSKSASGFMMTCERCLTVYHAKCLDPPPSKDSATLEEVYICNVCRSNEIVGVTDCLDLNDEANNTKRLETLALDKLGRRYWFLARRLFIVDEDENDVRYYSTKEQLEEALQNLEDNRFDKSIIRELRELQPEMERQMQITQTLNESLSKESKSENGSDSMNLSQENSHKQYVNHYSSNNLATRNQNLERDIARTLANKFCMSTANSYKWHGAIDGSLHVLTMTVRASLLKFEASIPSTFVHACWQSYRSTWLRAITSAQTPEDYAIALCKLETSLRPILFKSIWHDGVGFSQLFRSTAAEREELKKIDRQPRGFERREWVVQDFELSYRLGTMVKFSPKLKPVKHQVWKQKGEEYRLTGLNGWYWQGITFRSRLLRRPKLLKTEPYKCLSPMNNHPFVVDMIEQKIKACDVIDIAAELSLDEEHRCIYPKKPAPSSYKQQRISRLESLLKVRLEALEREKAVEAKAENGIITPAGETQKTNLTHTNLSQVKVQLKNQTSKKFTLAKPKLPPCHDFLTKRGKVRSILVLPDMELRKLARSGSQREAKSFLYTAKQNNYVWPYGMTPRPSFRTCWLYRNRLIDSIQEIAVQLRVLHACIRWDDLQVRPPVSGNNVIHTDDATVTIQVLKKRDKLPYLMHSEYLIRKTISPIEQPTKYRKIGTKSSQPSARSGLRARRQTEIEEERGPTTEEIWVAEDQLELWELKQFDEKIERQNQLLREKAFREEAEKRRKAEEEKRRKAELERTRRAEEEAKRVRLAQQRIAPVSAPVTPRGVRPQSTNSTPQPGLTPVTAPTTPVMRYFRTEQGQIIRLPASYLQRGTPLILRHVGPGPNQTSTYIIRPQMSAPNIIRTSAPIRFVASPVVPSQIVPSPATAVAPTPATTTAAPTAQAPPATTTTMSALVTTATISSDPSPPSMMKIAAPATSPAATSPPGATSPPTTTSPTTETKPNATTTV